MKMEEIRPSAARICSVMTCKLLNKGVIIPELRLKVLAAAIIGHTELVEAVIGLPWDSMVCDWLPVYFWR